MFQQVPMVEIDGMKLVQTRAILNYIATKYNLYGKDMQERALYGIFSVLSLMINKNDLGPSLSEQDVLTGIETRGKVSECLEDKTSEGKYLDELIRPFQKL